ncbi:sensory rhodopsin transducer [Natronobacterium gregoryi]|uniref:Uncharacterized protein n=2 Tax=Natronobacterium gregoryi TaxID=44930 RepID=L9XYS5_NATGS|nr:sensory rhodopsin transducer [Natronobacterium gregoryi]ELY66571.1 hypothetical protein C490_12402 [Natronobacterium gregoryi SP2]SFI83011.1 Anabaena sensory rhodopsin transducer [Natronobacterium gregoryi]
MTGKRTWTILEGYIPERNTGLEPEMCSRDSLWVLILPDRTM